MEPAGPMAVSLTPALSQGGEGDKERASRDFHGNGHGTRAIPKNVSRVRHGRFPHPNPLPEGEGDVERATRDFHRKSLGRS